jgi:hypothetical protein
MPTEFCNLYVYLYLHTNGCIVIGTSWLKLGLA